MNYFVLSIQRTSVCLTQIQFFTYQSQAEECFHQTCSDAAVADCHSYTIMLCNTDGTLIRNEYYE